MRINRKILKRRFLMNFPERPEDIFCYVCVLDVICVPKTGLVFWINWQDALNGFFFEAYIIGTVRKKIVEKTAVKDTLPISNPAMSEFG